MKEYLKTGFVLMIFTLISGFLLGVVYLVTLPYIEKAEFNAKLQAIELVLKSSDTDEFLISKSPSSEEDLNKVIWKESDENIIYKNSKNAKVFSPAYKFEEDGKEIYILTVSGIGYGGDVISVISFLKEDNIVNMNSIKVIDYSQETPGLGANIANEDAHKKIIRDAKSNNYMINTADVLTGATITVNGVAKSIEIAVDFLRNEGVM